MARTSWSMAMAAAFGLAVANAGCRSCAEERASAVDAGPAGPTMPAGMLMPLDAAGAGTGTGAAADGMRVAHGIKGGAWTELQIAQPGDAPARTNFQHWRDDSSFVSLEAMTLLHEAFARALPGFDLFLPRLFTPDALLLLAAELEALALRVANPPLAATARQIAQIARTAGDKGQSVWVLGP